MNKKSFQQLIVIVIFTIGGLIFTYPFYSNAINYVVDQYRLAQLENKVQENYEVQKANMEQANEKIRANGITIDHDPFDASLVKKNKLDLNKHLIGSITIPKINLTVPLFDTLTEEILENGAGVLQGTSMPTGGIGNHSVISAHRGLAERVLFRYLDKLENGDVFLIENSGELLAYKVIDSHTVKPEETEIIQQDPNKDLVSLLTCTPYMINSHRLIITGKRAEVTKEMVKSSNKSKNNQKWKEYSVLLGIGTLFLLILFLMIRVTIRGILSRRRYDFNFYLTNQDEKMLTETFTIYRKGKKKALRRDGEVLEVTNNSMGKVVINSLPGDIYTLALKSNPNKRIGHFGVNRLSQKKMKWLKNSKNNTNIIQKKNKSFLDIN
ncbi:class C sortase [Vagococcus fluvialis]|uniref:class C sortase n=1 Tax=Vagococcus fluvialis TaxID=2738 RepID=UPI003B5AAAFC